ncbi:MAG: hypothetical protein WC780_17140 [Lentimicrobiaceae bacterium]
MQIRNLIFLLSIIYSSSVFCQNSKCSLKKEINNLIRLNEKESLEIFDSWDIWKRSSGYVFDYEDAKYRILVIFDNKENMLFKEMFPLQDSVFSPLSEIENRKGDYPFITSNFANKVHLFRLLNVDQLISRPEEGITMFKAEGYTIIYSKTGNDVIGLSKYKEYIGSAEKLKYIK